MAFQVSIFISSDVPGESADSEWVTNPKSAI